MGFVHLHCHSQFSLLDGTMDPSTLAARVHTLGMGAVALTDTCNLYGAVTFYKAAKKKGVKPILGAELHLQPQGVDYEDPQREEGGGQVIALVENATGYQNLCWLVTQAIYDGIHYKPRVSVEQLAERHEGLIFLTGGRKGVFGRALLRGDSAASRQDLRDLAAVLPANRLYLELQSLGLDREVEVNQLARELALELGLQTVVTNAVHYETPLDAAAHEVLNAIALGVSLSDHRRVIAPTDQAYLKSEDEIRAIFPDDGPAIDRTVELADRCHYDFDFDTHHFPATTPPDVDKDGQHADSDANWAYFYAAFPPPASYGLTAPEVAIPPRPEGAGRMDGFFRWYTERGLEVRLKAIDEAQYPTYWARLEHEFAIISSMGFQAYFLIVAEFINWSKDNGIPVGPGRGSAAGSLVAYAMGITDIDPIRFDLLFERFLNPERVSMPDVDVDFCQDRREEAIAHVRDKYGSPLVSQIITYGKLKAKAAVRDVARVLDLGFNDADRIAKLIPDTLGMTLSEALDEVEALRRLRDGDPKVRRVIDTALRVENLCRQTGVHAAGVVIADRPLVEYAPLYRDGPDGGPVVQYDMKSAETIGLIKFDFLGLKTLDQIRDAVVMIEANYGEALDMALIPTDDPATYELLQRGDALGVFQLESSGMRELLTRLRPSVLDDLVALVALYRPGPLKSGMVDDFVDRKHGRQAIDYPLPMLEPILKSTYGTIIYQEQVMQIAQVMSGYSLGEADMLRRAMGKKKVEEMEKQRVRFVGGAERNNIDPQRAEAIFDLLAKFAAYGFNKSHSAAYGYVSYQTAFLKANYRSEYMAALMTIEAANTDKILMYIQDCRRAGMEILPVCLNHSQRAFSVPHEEADPAGYAPIRFGMAAVKNVGGGAIDAIVEAREHGGPFEGALDAWSRVDTRRVNKRAWENLIKAGAMDFCGVARSQLIAGLPAGMALASQQQRDAAQGQTSLFGASTATVNPTGFKVPDVLPWNLSDRLRLEREVLGLYLTGHPMASHQADVRRFGSAALHELGSVEADTEVRVLGVPSEVKTTKTRRGDRMAFVMLENEHAVVECVFFSDPWVRSQATLKSGEAIVVTGRLERNGESLKVIATAAEKIGDARARVVRRVRVDVDASSLTPKRLRTLAAILDDQRGDAVFQLRLRRTGAFVATFESTGRGVLPSVALEESIVGVLGQGVTVTMA